LQQQQQPEVELNDCSMGWKECVTEGDITYGFRGKIWLLVGPIIQPDAGIGKLDNSLTY
jgi:hypothetical protein